PAIDTLSLHDALPISAAARLPGPAQGRPLRRLLPTDAAGRGLARGVWLAARLIRLAAHRGQVDIVRGRDPRWSATVRPTSSVARSEEHTSELQSRENL